MSEFFSALLAVAIGVVGTAALQRGRPPGETRVVWVGLLGHLVASAAQVVITLYWYGGGDLVFYAETGAQAGRLLDIDPAFYGWELLKILFQQEGYVPIPMEGYGTSTGTMVVLAAFLLYPLGGSILAGCLLLSVVAFFSRVLLLRVYLRHLPSEQHRALCLAVLLVPSVTFWGAAIAKETVALIGLGPMFSGADLLLSGGGLRKRVQGAVPLLIGGAIVWLVKPYIVVAFVVGFCVWWYVSQLRARNLRPSAIHLLGGGAVGLIGIWALGEVVPTYSVDAVAERAAGLQAVGRTVDGGSNYELGNVAARGFGQQLLFAPMALVYSLFRPFIFESRNALMALNSLETTWITYLVARSAFRGGWRGVFDVVQRWPVLAFSMVFVLILGIGVGISTSNLGTLTRYRMPMVPFYVTFVIMWGQLQRVPSGVPNLPVRRRKPGSPVVIADAGR